MLSKVSLELVFSLNKLLLLFSFQVTFKDIHEMVQQTGQLRAIAQSLSQQNEEHEKELKVNE